MEKKRHYPGVFDRVKAVTIDSITIFIAIIITSDILSNFDDVLPAIRIFAFVLIFILYDPLFVSIFGGTVGHIIIGINVKNNSNKKQNINFHKALIRYILKYLLGWLSLLSVSSNPEKKAIHDIASGSIVLYTKKK